MSALLGAIEAGGTKVVCVVARDAATILAETRVATTTPAATLGAAEEFFAAVTSEMGALSAIGIASFGPLDVRRSSPTYGHLLATPKRGWASADLVAPFATRFSCPVVLDTDVNAAALAEALHGAGRGCGVVVYVTVGTGIGGGIVVNGRAVHGALHPEMGHVRVLRHERDRELPGVCAFHGDCLEGLASGSAIRARYGAPLDGLPAGHKAPEMVGYYLGQLAATIVLMISPERIVFGGGVMNNDRVLTELRSTAARFLNGYLPFAPGPNSLDELIVAPGLGERSGIVGAITLAEAARASGKKPL
jgi:fructokinase